MSEILSTAQFLDTVLPEGNHYIGYTDGTLNRANRPVIKCSSFKSGQHGVTVAGRKGDTDVFFALASFKQEKVYDEKNGYMKSYRHQDNVEALKALWLDVDIKSYDSTKECVEDIARFLQEFPDPTFLVYSGGGFHLYWVFEETLTQTQWLPLAQGLAGIAKAKKLRADYGVTIDSARVLRLPGSRNQKYAHKPLCEIKKMGNYASLARMDELLRPHAAGLKRAGIQVDSNVVALFDLATSNRELTDNYNPSKRSLFANIAPECAVVSDSLERGGDGDEYALWKDLLHLAAYTDDGEAYAHVISKGDARYEAENVDEFFSQSVAIRTAGTRGPVTCQRFSMHSDKCATCKHAGKIKSPWSLGIPIEEKFDNQPSFVLNGNTYTTKIVEGEDGEMTFEEEFLFPASLDGWRLVPTIDPEAPLEMWLDVENGRSKKVMKLSASEMGDTKQFRTVAFNAGIAFDLNQAGKIMKVAAKWYTHLSKLREGATYTSSGWNSSHDAFVMGDRAITKEGFEPVINALLGESDSIGSKGKPEPWLELTQKLLDDPDPSFTYLLCAGFAAPLMGILSHRCSLAISAYSSHSGAGKTTILRTVRSAWGTPRGGNALTDTTNSMVIKMGAEGGLPAVYDEIRGNDAGEKIVEILFQLTQGRTKARATTNATLRRQDNMNTMMLCGSNIPISDYINQRIKGSNAGFARFIELELQPRGTADIKLDALAAQLEENYGHFGPIYIGKILENMERLPAIEEQIFGVLQKQRTWTAEERYWLQATTKIMLAGKLMQATRLLKVDMSKLLAGCIAAIAGQKAEMDDKVSSDDDVLANLVNFFTNEMLITQTFVRGQGRNQKTPVVRAPLRNNLHIHASVDNAALRISVAALKDFAEARGESQKNLRTLLAGRFGAKTIRVALGGGTPYSTTAQTVIQLDLRTVADGDALIASWLPDDETESTSESPSET